MSLATLPQHILMLDGTCYGFEPSADGQTVAISRWVQGHHEFIIKDIEPHPIAQGRSRYLELLTRGARKV